MMMARRNASSCRLRAGAALLIAVAGSATCIAQTGSHLADPAQVAPSRWAADWARIDDQIRSRGMVADNPRAHWVAAHFDLTDVVSRVKHYAAARVNAPQEKLYLASLAIACLEPVQPTLPECDATDRLTDWTTRDADNGFPLLLLAARASKRNDNESTVAYLEQAAAMPRIDDYWSRGWLEYWEYVMALPIDADRAAKAEAAIGYAAAQPVPIASLLVPSNVCLGASGATDSRRTACAKAGRAMAERGTTAATRSVGASIAEHNAGDTGAAERARTMKATSLALNARCGADYTATVDALESADPAIRARTVDAWDKIVRNKASLGEMAECERRLGSSTRL
jgi:hypothetical protein